jgi:hypothetical protein
VGWKSGWDNVWTQAVIFPATMHHALRWRPYPPLIPSGAPEMMDILTFRSPSPEFLNWMQFYLPLAVYLIALSSYGSLFLKKRLPSNIQNFGAVTLTFLGILFFAQALSRYDYMHVLPSSIIAVMVIVPLLHRFISGLQNRMIKYSVLLLMVIVLTQYLSPLALLVSSAKEFSPIHTYSHLRKASGIYLKRDQEQAAEYITNHSSEGEPIFVGNQRHDLIFANDIGFYFLANRPCATKYHDLFPGVATTRSVQEVIVHDIESKNVRWIVLVYVPDPKEPNESAVSSGVHDLDDFIRANFTKAAEFGNYGIWKKGVE